MRNSILTLVVAVLAVWLVPAGGAQSAPGQTVIHAQDQPERQGPASNFTGQVTVRPVFEANQQAPYSGGLVTFQPGARSAWHIHKSGQRLYITSGVGRTGSWGGPVVEVRAGDSIWCPPGVKHWHGAAPDQAMSHLALTGAASQGQGVTWLEKVTDTQYQLGGVHSSEAKATQ